MNKNMKWISGLLCLVVGMTLGSCQSDDELQSSGQTGFLISLTDEFNQKVTRTTPEKLEKPVTSQFKLRVTDADSGKEAYAGQCTESVLLKAGSYDLTATFGENPVIALDAPYYMGTKENQNVEEGKMTSVDIPCSVANALLSVTFDEESLKKAFEDYYVAVSVGSESVNVDATSGKSAYFRAGSSVELTFHGFMLGTGKEMTYDIPEPESEEESGNGSFTAIPAKTHVKVTLKFNGSVSTGAGISISKLQVDTVSIGKTLPLEMMPKPKLEAEGFENNELVFAETEKDTATLHLKLSSPLQDLKMNFKFEDVQFAELNGKEYLLSKDKETIEQVLGITLPDISATDATIDFSNLIAKIQTNAGVTTRNIIEIEAMANDRWSSEVVEGQEPQNGTFTFTCNKPEFKVSAYPGNIWTKEFTMNPLLAEDVISGDYETLSKKMRYQFSIDGETNWTDFGEDLRKADLTPGSTYYIRGVYRDEVEGEIVTVTTYPIIDLENGDMEQWDYEITDDSRNPITKNVDKIYWKKWFPWNSVAYSSIWNTVNQTTTQDGNSPGVFLGLPTPPYVGCCYVANSGTIPVEGSEAYNSKSALLKTVGWGSGSTGGGGASEIKHVTPAELYLGTYDLINHQPIYGIEYESRPTAIKFWCRYEPKSTDLLIAKMVILDDEGVEIGSASIPSEEAGKTEWVEKKLLINYTDLEKAPAKMYVLFKSGTITDTGVMDKPAVGNLSDGESVGSKLYIDDISLIYDK